VAQILHDLDYSLQGNRKTEEGGDHPDRDAQFRHINTAVKRYLTGGWPVISVDTKRKELIGNYYNAGQQWRTTKQPRNAQGHDFPGPDVPRAYPLVFTMSGLIPGSSILGPIMMPVPLPWPRFGAGGGKKGNISIPGPRRS